MAQIPPVCCPAIRAALCSFFVWCFSGRLPIGIAHFDPLKGGNACQFVVGCLPTTIPVFFTPKTKGNACHFFRGCLLVPFRFQNRPFRRQTRLNLAPEVSILGFGSAECRGLAVLLRTWREEPTRLHNDELPLRNYFLTLLLPPSLLSRVRCGPSAFCKRGAESSNLSKHGQGSLAGPL